MESYKRASLKIESSGIYPLRSNILIGRDYETKEEIVRTKTAGFEGNSPAFLKLVSLLKNKGYRLDQESLDYARDELALYMPTFGEILSYPMKFIK